MDQTQPQNILSKKYSKYETISIRHLNINPEDIVITLNYGSTRFKAVNRG